MEQEINSHLPLYFAAPLSWYAEIIGRDVICIVDDDTYQEHPCMNRISFAGRQGRQLFSIPLVNRSRRSRYKDVEISYHSNWHKQLVNALRTGYGKSPFFEYFDYRLEPIILKGHRYLWDLNYAMLEETLKCLKIPAALKTVNGVSASFEAAFGKTYYQVFAGDTGFISNLSILDLLFNEGIDAPSILSGAKMQ